MLLRRRDERLDDVDVALPTIGQQLACRQSLENRLMLTPESLTPKWSQIRSASAGCAFPVNTTTSATITPMLQRLNCARTP